MEIWNENYVWHVPIVFWVFSTKTFGAVIFTVFVSPCMHTRSLEYLDTLVLHRACAPCTHACIAHARHDVTQFTYNVNHVITTPAAFVFHLCHVGIRWHDIIGVHIP